MTEGSNAPIPGARSPRRLNYVPWRLSVDLASSRPSPRPEFLESMCTRDVSEVLGMCVTINVSVSRFYAQRNWSVWNNVNSATSL